MRQIALTLLTSLGLFAAGLSACDSDPVGGEDAGIGTDAANDTTAADGAGDTTADTGEADTTPPIECPEPTGIRPGARAEHAGIYDPVNNDLVFFGGSFGVPQNCSSIVAHTYEQETWIYDIDCDQWSQVGDTDAPVGRVRHQAVYDSARHRMIVWGGRERAGSSGTYTLHSEVLAFDLETRTWSEIVVSGGPSARFNHVMVYDEAGDKVVIFSGNTSGNPLVYSDSNDVWTLDLASNTWSEITAGGNGKPAKRFWGAGLWDAGRSWLVIFGGTDAANVFNPASNYMEDVWALDFSATPPVWYRLDTGGNGPLGRFWSGLVHDTANDRYVLFGGHDDGQLGNRNDMWALGPLTGEWEVIKIGDTFNKPAAGVCDFPPDFTVVDSDVPERRHAGVIVDAGGKVIISGGKTDCGIIDDVFAYDFSAETWEELVTASRGEVCLRKGGVNCNDLCL